MDFALNDEQRALQGTARRFACEQIIPVAQSIETEGQPLNRERVRYVDIGFLGINVAKKYGVLGLGNLEALIVLEGLAKVASATTCPIFASYASRTN